MLQSDTWIIHHVNNSIDSIVFTMKKEGLKEKILIHFQSRYRNGKTEPVHSQKIDDWGHQFGYKHETVGRCLRMLAEQGLLKASYQTMKKTRGETVYYEYVPTQRDKLVKSLKNA